MIRRTTPPFAALACLALGACGGSSPADNASDRLDKAAEQSDPAAAEVLRNAADQVSDSNVQNPDAAVQQAMQAAGNAQAATVGGAQQATPAPPAAGAKPHAKGDPVPPPKMPAGKTAPGGMAPTGEEG